MATITKAPEGYVSYLSLVQDKGNDELAVLATFNLANCEMPMDYFMDVISRFIKGIDGEVMLLERQDAPDTIDEEF